MRDIILTMIVFGSLPLIFQRPYIGILVWSWLSYMNPHRLTWGFAYDFAFAQIVVIATFVSLFLSKDPKRFPINPFTILTILFVIWMGITTVFALLPEDAQSHFIKILKVQFGILVTLLLIDTREKIIQLVWVIALSIGFFGIKGGIFTISTGGGSRVWGPPGSFIEDNNELGLALLMILPLFYFLYKQLDRKWMRWGMLAAMVLISVSIIGSQSRGCMLAGLAVAFFFWLKSSNKFPMTIAIAVLLSGLLAFAPQTWYDRMDTISKYEEDNSAMGRINAWGYAFNVANSRLTGAGYNSYSYETFYIYAPDPGDVHAAHSIYFGVLADHGWIGLILFLSLLYISWKNAVWIIRHCRGFEQHDWLVDLAKMLQISLIAYASGGAFYSLAYFDLPWHVMALLMILRTQAESVLQKEPTSRLQATDQRGIA